MHRIRRFGVIKTATTVAVIYVVVIAIFAIPFAIFAATGGSFSTTGPRLGLVEVLTFALIGVVVYGVLGWIFTAIACAIYNVAARFTGGIEVEVDTVAPQAPPPVWPGMTQGGPPAAPPPPS